MRPDKYIENEGLNYSQLADFDENPDKLLLEKEHKPYHDFGNAFELLLMDNVKGTNVFSKYFYVLDDKYLTNMNTIYKKYENDKNLLQIMDINKSFISTGWLKIIAEMIGNTLLSKVTIFNKEFNTIDLLTRAKWSLDHYWESYGIKKKCLFDLVVFIKLDNVNYAIPFDVKTTESLNSSSLKSMFRTRYWIQDIHYCEGLKDYCKGKDLTPYENMIFLVSQKKEPYTFQSIICEYDDDLRQSRYDLLCTELNNWIIKGREKHGWLQTKILPIYL